MDRNMDNLDLIRDSLIQISNILGLALSHVHILPLAPEKISEYMARLSFHVAPSYLPFATDDSGVFAIFTWPGSDFLNAPIVHVPHDQQEARFVCDTLQSLPSAIWLWVSSRFADRPEVLRQATDELASAIPKGRPVKEELWRYLNSGVSRWDSNSQPANEAWALAGVGHPFAGMPQIKLMTKPQEALPMLEPFVRERRNEPEVLSAFLATLAGAHLPRPTDQVLSVLGAEAWRQLGCFVDGFWRASGAGICEWDCTLKNTEDPVATFAGTHFEPLIGHSDTYSSEDKEGPKRLLSIADKFQKAEDPAGELRQIRNAVTLAILTAGEYPLPYAKRIASVCDAIEKDSLAAAIARESARVHSQGP
jgi:hypothetical protein